MDPSSQGGSVVLTVAIICALIATTISLGYLAVVGWQDSRVLGVSARVRRGLWGLVISFAALTGACWIAANPRFDWSDYFILGAGVGIAAFWFPRKDRVVAPSGTAASSSQYR